MDSIQGPYVVVGVDGSESALSAVRWAADEAARRRTPLLLVSAFGWTGELAAPSFYAGAYVGARYRDVLFHESRQALATAVVTARETQPDLELCDELRLGHPSSTRGSPC